jgi:hypothetical protein
VADTGPRRPLAATASVILSVSLFSLASAGRVHAQDTEPKPEPSGDAPPLSARYRFIERYTVEADPKRPEALSQYRVGSRDTVRVVRDRPQGTPERDESSLQMIYTERAAKLARDGTVGEAVRRYDRVNFKTTLPIQPFKTKFLEGLMILYRLSNRSTPLVASLSDRVLRQQEFERINQQAFLPAVASLLPRTASRVGDTWPISKLPTRAMIGAMPVDDEFSLMAELIEVHKNKAGNSMTAVIGIKGQFSVDEGPTAINAQVDFTFEPTPVRQNRPGRPGDDAATDQPAGAAAAGGKVVEGLFDAKGYISKVRLAQAMTLPLGEEDGRLKQTITRELLLERRISGQGDGSALPLPEANFAAGPANSWLLYDDPQGRFHFLHPQDLRIAKVYPEGGVDLLDRRPDGQDVLQIALIPKTQDPQRDRLAGDPIQQKKLLEDQWKRQGQKVLPGPAGWLSDPELARLNRKVYRIEAALVPAEDSPETPPGGRIYLDHYIVQFSRNEVLKVIAMTTQDPHVPFSKVAELVIKTFDFGPSESTKPPAILSAPSPAASGPAPGPAPRPPSSSRDSNP